MTAMAPLLGAASLVFISVLARTAAFSTPSAGGNGGGASSSYMLSERFRATCPADPSSIRQFEPSLVPADCQDDDDSTWVAVFRSSNNLPSVMVRDDFMNAMRIATTVQTDSAARSFQTPSAPSGIETPDSASEDGEGVKTSTPVAVARLCKSADFPDRYVIDSLRCTLKKEDQNEACDGGSEHCEAISVCIDELILHHLKQPGRKFDGAIRCKATLFSGKLLEERGFVENAELSRDMATHISSLDDSMDRYADRAVSQAAKNPGARDRASQILSFLGRLNRDEEVRKTIETEAAEKDDEGDDYDPWAGSNLL